MCEVGSCCGCISLYRGCLIIGFVTIVASITQALVFSLILFESYDSYRSSSTINKTIADEELEGSSYSFSSSLCPFGFIPLAKTIRNDTAFTNVTLEPLTNASAFPLVEVDDTPLTNGSAFSSVGVDGPTPRVTNGSAFSSVVVDGPLPPLTNWSAPQGANLSALFNGTALTTTKISCLAPTQGVLWALVIASCLYAPVGLLLMIGVKKGATCLLSTWFFYTVGYNLMALIVALTDGVYTGAADVSSYLVCLVTVYCIIVVDSYYEKLLRNERIETTSRARPSLVVAKSTPNSPGLSPEDPPLCTPPSGRTINLPPGYAKACEANDLLLPSGAYRESSPA